MSEIETGAVVVYKLGGSLLDLPGLTGILREVISQRPDQRAIVVVGGGRTADIVRDWDRTHRIGEEPAHWLALQAMRLNEALLMQLCPDACPVRNRRQALGVSGAGPFGVLCADCFVRGAEATGHEPLPRNWQVTSDSIAAWSADVIGASELVLLKSTELADNLSLVQATADGLVDELFPRFAKKLPHLGWVNCRTHPREIRPWQAG